MDLPTDPGLCQAWVDSRGVRMVCRGDRIAAVLRDLDHVRARHAITHHDACWEEHIACLASRIRYTLTGGADHG